jgi:hypothetical protein
MVRSAIGLDLGPDLGAKIARLRAEGGTGIEVEQ